MKRVLSVCFLFLVLCLAASASEVYWTVQPACSMAWMENYGCISQDTVVWVDAYGLHGSIVLTLTYTSNGAAYTKSEVVYADESGHIVGLFMIPSDGEVLNVMPVEASGRASPKRR